jgi:hypothetical protein
MAGENLYQAVIAAIFSEKYKPGMRQVEFDRDEIPEKAEALGLSRPKNLGDLVYSFRYRAVLPKSIQKTAGEGEAWIIRSTGRGKYKFALVEHVKIAPNVSLAKTKVPDSTPGVVAMYAFNDEQALLAKVRYNRLIDIFSAVTCYSLQNHLRTTVEGMGQVETDEIYVGVDKRGAHYVFPVQAKGGTDRLGIVQIEQDFGVCLQHFPGLMCRPIAVQCMADGTIAMFEFVETEEGVRIAAEKHYQLVPSDQVTDGDLKSYREAPQ